MNFTSILSIFIGLFVGFEIVAGSLSFSLTVYWIDWGWAGIHDIGFEQIGDLSDVVGLEFFSIDGWIHFEVKIKKIFGTIILIHSYIFELKVDPDVMIGKEWWEFDELISKILNELIINIGNPGL